MEENINLIDVRTINAAVTGETWTVQKVVEHYADEINRLSTRKRKEPDGRVIEIMDEDMRQSIILSLIKSLSHFKEDFNE